MAKPRSTGRSHTLVACATLLASAFLTAGTAGTPAFASVPAAASQVLISSKDRLDAYDALATFGRHQEDKVDKTDSSTDSDGAGDVPWPIVLMLFGGGAIFGVIGVVTLNRSRRSRRS